MSDVSFMSSLDSLMAPPIWGALAGSIFVFQLVMFGVTKRPLVLAGAMAAMVLGGPTVLEPDRLVGFWLPPGVVVALLMLLSAGVWFHSTIAISAVPKPVAESGNTKSLEALRVWLFDIEDSLPQSCAREGSFNSNAPLRVG